MRYNEKTAFLLGALAGSMITTHALSNRTKLTISSAHGNVEDKIEPAKVSPPAIQRDQRLPKGEMDAFSRAMFYLGSALAVSSVVVVIVLWVAIAVLMITK